MESAITVFLPCRAGSQRVRRKNTRAFAGYSDGLLGIKLRQLVAVPSIDRIILSTNDPEAIAIARPFAERDERVTVALRPEELASSATSTDDLVVHGLECVGSGVMLWTHVTSPFVSTNDYEMMIAAYSEAIARGSHDSLASVGVIQKFLWRRGSPINYDRTVEKWPRTQTLEPIYELNSAAFIVDVATGRKRADRLGDNPFLYVLKSWKGFDLDWEEDFEIGENVARSIFKGDLSRNVIELPGRSDPKVD